VLLLLALRSRDQSPAELPAPAAATSAPAAAVQPPPAAAPEDKTVVVHRLPKEESLRELGSELWQGADNTAALMKANPAISSADARVAKDTPVRIPRTTLYKVVPGDTLGSIAQKTLGREEAYSAIQEANKETLPDADSLEAGMTLTIPLVSAELEKRLAPSAVAAAPAPGAAAAPAPH
jgi:nucleoid-associated protein YgaU